MTNHNDKFKEYLEHYAKGSSEPSGLAYSYKFKVYGIAEKELIKMVKMNNMESEEVHPVSASKINFTCQQLDWIVFTVDDWYSAWKPKISTYGMTKTFELAKEHLKDLLLGELGK